MAQSFCAGHNYGVVMAIRRNCPSRRSCNAICAAKRVDILYTHHINKSRVSCYAVYKIRKNFKKLQDNPRRSQPDAERVIFQSSGYGKGGCAQIEKGRRCGPGPNYCCCNAF
ncbi:Hypothetical predicted protein [Mytilus galloprovincialis]|nr:Hypothetical predicted protein [Mytilus galloprovincialis]